MIKRGLILLTLILSPGLAWAGEGAAADELHRKIDRMAAEVEDKVIEWRRDIHQNPELSNREFRTSKLVADHLKRLGMEVKTGVAHTGVVALLRGGRPGPVVALRADMDALPVTEATGLPFASKVRAEYNGQEVGVMHACGHDAHVAILMGAAEVLSGLREELPGTVKFLFQPAEEGAPEGEEGGAELMLKEGAFDEPRPDAVFGLHITSNAPVSTINYRPGGALASSDVLRILVRGRQTHGASPWQGIDPVVTAAQIILGLQTIASRQVDTTKAPAVVTIGSIHGGVRSNIIPSQVEMVGTIRALDPEMQKDVHERIRRTAVKIAESAGAEAEVEIYLGYPVTYNDPELTEKVLPTLRRVAGNDRVRLGRAVTGAEDFSFFAREAPGFFFFLGATPADVPPHKAPAHHTPTFFIDESSFLLGVRSMVHLAFDYLGEIGR